MSAWWLLCTGSVGSMLGFCLAAMLAAGKRADLESALAEAQASEAGARACEAAWHDRHDALANAFSTLCRAMVKVGIGTKEGDVERTGREIYIKGRDETVHFVCNDDGAELRVFTGGQPVVVDKLYGPTGTDEVRLSLDRRKADWEWVVESWQQDDDDGLTGHWRERARFYCQEGLRGCDEMPGTAPRAPNDEGGKS
jgi:hypothetical protein